MGYLDLRKNGGGDPATVALLASYLFDQRTHLNDIFDRRIRPGLAGLHRHGPNG